MELYPLKGIRNYFCKNEPSKLKIAVSPLKFIIQLSQLTSSTQPKNKSSFWGIETDVALDGNPFPSRQDAFFMRWATTWRTIS